MYKRRRSSSCSRTSSSSYASQHRRRARRLEQDQEESEGGEAVFQRLLQAEQELRRSNLQLQEEKRLREVAEAAAHEQHESKEHDPCDLHDTLVCRRRRDSRREQELEDEVHRRKKAETEALEAWSRLKQREEELDQNLEKEMRRLASEAEALEECKRMRMVAEAEAWEERKRVERREAELDVLQEKLASEQRRVCRREEELEGEMRRRVDAEAEVQEERNRLWRREKELDHIRDTLATEQERVNRLSNELEEETRQRSIAEVETIEERGRVQKKEEELNILEDQLNLEQERVKRREDKLEKERQQRMRIEAEANDKLEKERQQRMRIEAEANEQRARVRRRTEELEDVEAKLENVELERQRLLALHRDLTSVQAGEKKGEDRARPHDTCYFAARAKEFLQCTGLPECYFDAQFDRCYCRGCYPTDYPDKIDQDGSTYIVPRGWAGFGLKLPSRANDPSMNIFRSWSVSFHGTRPDVAKKILQDGSFAIPGDKLSDGSMLMSCNSAGRLDEHFYTSPTVNYAGLQLYSDPVTLPGFLHSVGQVVLMCRQKESTLLRKQPETMGFRKAGYAHNHLCKYTSLGEDIEWLSQSRTGCIPYRILVRTFKRSEVPHVTFRSPHDKPAGRLGGRLWL